MNHDDVTILLLSDLQVGSAFGIFPDKHPLSTGGKAALNTGQRYLLRCWDDMCAHLPEKLDYLILPGDMVEGQQYKEMGLGLTEIDPEWQVDAAHTLLAPLAAKATETYCVAGTGYHVGKGARAEQSLGRLLGAVRDEWNSAVWSWLLLDIGGVILDIAHAQSVMLRYKATPLERELQFAQMIDSDLRPDVDLIVRAHVHTYGWHNFDGYLVLSMPAFQLPTTYVKTSKAPNRYVSRLLGGVLLTVTPGRKQRNTRNRAEYIQHEALTYNQPAMRAHKGAV